MINTIRPGVIEKEVIIEREKRAKKVKQGNPIQVIPEIAHLLQDFVSISTD